MSRVTDALLPRMIEIRDARNAENSFAALDERFAEGGPFPRKADSQRRR